MGNKTTHFLLPVLLAWATLSSTMLGAQTATNTCGYNAGNQYPVNGTCTFTSFDKPGSFTAAMNPGGCNSGNFDDAFGWFTAISTTTIITFDPDDGHRPIMHVFTGACGALTQVGCDDAGGNGNNAELILQTVVGTNYMIRIQRQGTNNSMDGRLCVWSPNTTNWCGFPAISQIPVEYPCTPRPFVKPSEYTATNNPGGCNSSNVDDAYGWFTATGTTSIITYDPDNNHRPIMHVFTGTCGALTQVACIDAGANGNNAVITLATTIGTNYLIRIQRQGTSDAMNGTICITRPPTNTTCATAIDLPVFDGCFLQQFSNTGAGNSGATPAPVCGGTPNNDVWFRFTTPTSGAVRIYTEAGGLVDASMQLYTGTCGSLSLVAGGCDNDGGSEPNDLMPYLDRRCNPLNGGTTYYLRVWGYNGANGGFGLCVFGPDIFNTPIQDCNGGFTVCGSGPINNNSDWTGCSPDLNETNRGCLSMNERQGTWYFFSPQAAGNVGFIIQPTDNMGNPANIDYDFAVWGPMSTVTCPPASAPLRCSYAYPPAAGTWLTGIAAGNTDVSEGASGTGVNGFVAPINVSAANVGMIYVVYIDNFSLNGQSFNLGWNLSNPNQLDCSLLPIALLDLKATRVNNSILVQWTAQDAAASDLFIVERSTDGSTFEPIGTVGAFPNGQGTTEYSFEDRQPVPGMNYYRLNMVQSDGSTELSKIVSALYSRTINALMIVPNPASNQINIITKDMADLDGLFLKVLDNSGRVVGTEQRIVKGSSTNIQMDITTLDPGHYFLYLSDPSGDPVGTGRFVKE